MEFSNNNLFKKVISNTIKNYDIDLEQKNIDSLVVTVSIFINKILGATSECGLEQDDFITPIWIATEEACQKIANNETKSVGGFIYCCIKNKILDVSKKITAKKYFALNNAMKTKQQGSYFKSDCVEDTFDHQTSNLLEELDEQNEYNHIVKLCMEEEINAIKKERSKQVVLDWLRGESRDEISEKNSISKRQIMRVISEYVRGARRRVEEYLDLSPSEVN